MNALRMRYVSRRHSITFWSQGAEKLYGWTKEEAIGQKTRALFKTTFPESLDTIVNHLKRIGKWSGELIHHAKDGRVRLQKTNKSSLFIAIIR